MRTYADELGGYLARIGAIALLTAEQEVELAKRMEAGGYARHLLDERPFTSSIPRPELEMLAREGRAARARMIEANLRLVVAVARRHAQPSVPLMDLIQEGDVGLIDAVDRFDYRRGAKFSTYAMWWVRKAIRRLLAEQPLLAAVPVVEAPDQEGRRPDAVVESAELSAGVRAMLSDLDAREAQVLSLKYGLDDGRTYTLGQVGRRLGMPRTWVRLLEDRSLARLRARSGSRDLLAML
ncbi:sigma-70 family RNA polymerase sigma factor [Acrocarpospora sp. B8E8]|uniref:sigma-70 family RNA polymerase sigma factor n=1 Tax=Acrocarpospora sp. B8E8 TaxID=3153572 RepID=UPI00325C4416